MDAPFPPKTSSDAQSDALTDPNLNHADLEDRAMMALTEAGMEELARLWQSRLLSPAAWAAHVCTVTGWEPDLLIGPRPEASPSGIFRRVIRLLDAQRGDLTSTTRSQPDLSLLLAAELKQDAPPSQWHQRQLTGELVARLSSLQQSLGGLVSDARSTADHCAVATCRLIQEPDAATLPEAPAPLPRRSPAREAVATPRVGVDRWEANRRRLREFYQRVASGAPVPGDST